MKTPGRSVLFSLLVVIALLALASLRARAATAGGAVRAEAAAPAATPTRDPATTLPSTLDHAQGLLTLGVRLTERGDFAAAEIAFRQVLDTAGFTPAEQQEALIGIARMYRRQGTFSKAAAIYEKFLKEFPDDPRRPTLLLELGRTLRAMGAYRLALSRFYAVINSTLKLTPDSFGEYQQLAKTAQFEIAETHFESGNYAEAGKFFARLRLLDLAPVDRARAHFKAAFSLQLGGQLEEAVRMLRDYLEHWPSDDHAGEARYLLASTLWRLDRRDDALAATMDLLRIEHGASGGDARRWAYWQRRTGNQLANEFFQAGETPGALSIYLGLATLAPDPLWRLPSLYQAGLCYERLRAFEPARATYRLIVAETPRDATPDLAELARMAAWRLDHLAWTHATEQQLHAFFATIPPPKSLPLPPPPLPADDHLGSPAATPAAL